MCALCTINVVRIWHMEGHIYVLSLNIICANFFEVLNVESAFLSAEVANIDCVASCDKWQQHKSVYYLVTSVDCVACRLCSMSQLLQIKLSL
jgi:hypothetical protein